MIKPAGWASPPKITSHRQTTSPLRRARHERLLTPLAVDRAFGYYYFDSHMRISVGEPFVTEWIDAWILG